MKKRTSIVVERQNSHQHRKLVNNWFVAQNLSGKAFLAGGNSGVDDIHSLTYLLSNGMMMMMMAIIIATADKHSLSLENRNGNGKCLLPCYIALTELPTVNWTERTLWWSIQLRRKKTQVTSTVKRTGDLLANLSIHRQKREKVGTPWRRRTNCDVSHECSCCPPVPSSDTEKTGQCLAREPREW